MKISSLHTGLYLTFESNLYRIVRITEKGVCHLEKEEDLSLISRTKQEVLDLMIKGKIILHGNECCVPSNSYIERDLAGLPEKQQEAVAKRYEYIKQAEKQLGSMPTRKGLEEVIYCVAKLIEDPKPPSVSTVHRFWVKWRSSNHNLQSLLNAKRGPRSRRKYKSKFFSVFHEVVSEVYLQREGHSKQDTYDALCSRLKSMNAISEKPIKLPSRATFYRMITELNQYEVKSAREGKKAADYYFRATGPGVLTHYILERVEVDHTEADVMVVNSENGLVIGRPYITVLLDVHSRYPLGFEIGFEPPSELSVMRALRNAILPKTTIKKQFSHIQNEWVAYGIPSTLVCDNGLEFHSSQLRRMCMELNIELIFCPKKEPNYKGCIERFLSTLNHKICQRIKGTTYSSIVKRGDYDSQGLACITLEKLKELMLIWVIDVYCQDIHSSLSATPSDVWQKGLTQVEPLLPESKAALDLILTKEYRRKLSHEGIRLTKLLYNSEELRLMRIRNGNHADVSIRVDLDNLGSIWVYNDYIGEYILVPCTNSNYAEGLSFFQHKVICAQKRQEGLLAYDEEALLDAKENLRIKLQDVYVEKIRPITKRRQAARLSTPKITPFSSNQSMAKEEFPDITEPIEIPDFDVFEYESETRGDR